MKSINAILRKLTFDDLRDWAGETILNRGKGYVKRVDHLSLTQDKTLAAWVTGSEQYATSVHVDEAGDFEYFCTCPYSWWPCKHTVAVILAAAEQVKRKETIPLLDEDNELSQARSDRDASTSDLAMVRDRRSDTEQRLAAIEKIIDDDQRQVMLLFQPSALGFHLQHADPGVVINENRQFIYAFREGYYNWNYNYCQ